MSMKTVTSNTAVVSDVDGTLLKGSLVLDHACYIHDHNIVNLGDIVHEWKNDPKNEELITALAETYREKIVGHTPTSLRTPQYIKDTISDPNKFYSSIERLQDAKSTGADVYLVSGSPSFLLTPFARHFKFRSKGSLYKTDQHNRFTGEIIGMFNAEAKRKHVHKLKIAELYTTITAYGDTTSDKPLFDIAHHSVLVDPHHHTLANIGTVDEIIYH